MSNKAIYISHTAVGGSMNTHRMLMLVLIAAVCVMGVGIGAACERMDLMEGKSGAVKVLGRQSNRSVYCGSNYGGAKLW